MTDAFEDSLRDSLQRVLPAAPDEPNRSERARAYAAQARRRRAGGLAVGAAAVMVAAIAVVPSLLDRGDQANVPIAGPTQRQSPQQTGRQPDQPFECPKPAGPGLPIGNPPDGAVAAGAVLARVCTVQPEGLPWAPPLDALTSGVGVVAQTVNSLPVADDKLACTEELGPAYVMVFQYPDGHTVQVRGDLYGCRIVSFGSLQRQGAYDALKAYFDALARQRIGSGPPPPSSLPSATCTGSGQMFATTLIPQDLSHLVVTKASVCAYDGVSLELGDHGALTPDQVAAVSADLQAHSSPGYVAPSCPAAKTQVVVLARNEYGDVLALPEDCARAFTWADQGWTPTRATLDMLRAVLR